MRNHLKKLLVVLCMLTFVMSLTACGNSANDNKIKYDESSVQSRAESFVKIYAMSDNNLLEEFLKADPIDIETYFKEQYGVELDGAAFLAGITSWKSAQEDLGTFGEITGTSMSSDKEKIIAHVAITGSSHNAEVEVIFDHRLKLTSCATNIDYSFGELMEGAALNTLLGMGSVFVVLILISLIIYSFNIFAVIEKKNKEKKEAKAKSETSAVDNTIAQIIEKEEATDDLELIAVISAAIAAYESSNGNTGDGYVVRSIRRRY